MVMAHLLLSLNAALQRDTGPGLLDEYEALTRPRIRWVQSLQQTSDSLCELHGAHNLLRLETRTGRQCGKDHICR